MKERITSLKRYTQKWFMCFLLAALLVPGLSAAQDSTAAEETATEEEVADEPELISPLIEFTSVQKSDQTIDLRASLKAKVDGQLIKLPGLKILFFAGADDTELGSAVTDKNGIALLNIKAEQLVADTAGLMNFKMTYDGSKTIDPAEEVLAIKRARLDLVPVKQDSVISLQLKLVDLSTGEEIPVPETELGVFIKRLFNPLKVAEGTTDESGEAIIEIPNDLPGDEKGSLTLMARITDNETYGNLEATTVQNWGTPVSAEMKAFPRALWSSSPPLWMLVTFIILMSVVWGHYIVIVYELFRLKREH